MLVVDVGSVMTRAMLFDVVDGQYRFLASGAAPSTAGAPYHNVSEGVRSALDRLQSITGRVLIGADEQLIIPCSGEGTGVDTFAATISAGPPIKVVAVGLLEDVSLESARRLAMTTYSTIVQTINLNDRRKPEARIDSILRLRPNLIVAAGGTEDGASQSVLKLLEAVGLACYLLPQEQRPEIIFAGNQALQDEIQSLLGGVAAVHYAPNIRPTLEVEQLEAAQSEVAHLVSQMRVRSLPGVEDLNSWAGGGLIPTATAFGRIIRFLSESHVSNKGVFGIDIGSSATSVAAAFSGSLYSGVFPQLGLGYGLAGHFERVPYRDVAQWLTYDISEDNLREYILNKKIHPTTLPATQEDMELEQAMARCSMQAAVKNIVSWFPPTVAIPGDGLLPPVEPIFATGGVLSGAPSLAHAVMMLLDGLQPTGTSTLILDKSHLASALGAAAALNPLLVVQVLSSNAFTYLGTVISPVGNARFGTPILRLKMVYENDQELTREIKQGDLEVLPLPSGQSARIQLYPLHRYDIGMGAPGRGGGLRVAGGALGVVIDARGRPLSLPGDSGKRSELLKKWLWTLGGQ
ncbi:MAG: glutamate mutase L [Anaerolineales bacterium]|nr:glutamate mutase L [Anaerolineales bacterium]